MKLCEINQIVWSWVTFNGTVVIVAKFKIAYDVFLQAQATLRWIYVPLMSLKDCKRICDHVKE